MHRENEVCYERDTDRKLVCSEPECTEGHVKWPLKFIKVKSMSVNMAMNAKEEGEKDGIVNMTMGCSNEGLKVPDAALFGM